MLVIFDYGDRSDDNNNTCMCVSFVSATATGGRSFSEVRKVIMEKGAPVDGLLQCGNTPTAHTVSTVATSVSLRSCDQGTQCTTNTLLIF